MLAEAREVLARYGVEPIAPAVPDEEDAWPDAHDFATETSQFVDFSVGRRS